MSPRKTSGYSGTPLVKKLGIKPAFRMTAVGEPEDYWELVAPLPGDVEVLGGRSRGLDFAHVFAKRETDLATRLPGVRNRIKPTGMIWVSWPKKSSGVPSDITEDVVRKHAFANELVDVKVCAVDETWSGLKLVIRLQDRK